MYDLRLLFSVAISLRCSLCIRGYAWLERMGEVRMSYGRTDFLGKKYFDEFEDVHLLAMHSSTKVKYSQNVGEKKT
jgi:hypothetical protein